MKNAWIWWRKRGGVVCGGKSQRADGRHKEIKRAVACSFLDVGNRLVALKLILVGIPDGEKSIQIAEHQIHQG